jgi:hypothetical protein
MSSSLDRRGFDAVSQSTPFESEYRAFPDEPQAASDAVKPFAYSPRTGQSRTDNIRAAPFHACS